jgi:superfamily II DNA or RNA helicase
MIIGMIQVRIDDRLRVRKADLPIGHEEAIKARLTVPNGDKAAARRRRQWGWQDLPDSFVLYEHAGPYLVMPRGYAAELRAGLELAGHEVSWDDQTTAPQVPLLELPTRWPRLEPDQERACVALLTHRQGVLQAPPGSGKTVIVLEAWRRAGLRGLVLVEKAGLARQWRERAVQHLGYEPGMIGEGEWDERPLTVAMMQTLHRREIGDAWWARWGFVVLDECHHAPAVTFQSVLRRARSRYLGGVTATALDGEWVQPFLTHVIGPIFHVTTDEQLRRTGRRATPLIRRVHTGWRWRPSAQEAKLVDTAAIYRHLIKQLEDDLGRVGVIARTIIEQPTGCCQLVLSKRLDYLERIKTALEFGGYEGEVYMMRGSESGERRAEIAELADAGGCVILSTVADEGVDIPRLDRGHLVWPSRKDRPLIQAIGRFLRTHPDKREVVVFDYVDEEGVLVSQARSRARVYRQAGYAIEEERVVQGSFTE